MGFRSRKGCSRKQCILVMLFAVISSYIATFTYIFRHIEPSDVDTETTQYSDDSDFCSVLIGSQHIHLYANDFEYIGRFARCYKREFTRFVRKGAFEQTQPPPEELENTLYPFLVRMRFASAVELYSGYAGRGIVMTSGNNDFQYALINIKLIRRLGCSLPIEFFYYGDKDLSPSFQKRVEVLQNVKLVDMARLYLDPSIVGYAMKPFSLLASSFEEVLFIDGDAFFFSNPEHLFDHSLYRHTGTLFFRDRSLPYDAKKRPGIMKMLVGLTQRNMSELAKEGRLMARKTEHEMEAGVVLWNKKSHFNALLLTCLFNSKPYSDVVYDKVFGDKETFWLAHETLAEPYGFYSFGGSAIGIKQDAFTVCGSLLHVQEGTRRPLWFNGGLQVNKDFPEGQDLINMTHYSIDEVFDDLDWEWAHGDVSWCHSVSNVSLVGVLNQNELDIIAWLQKSWLSEF